MAKFCNLASQFCHLQKLLECAKIKSYFPSTSSILSLSIKKDVLRARSRHQRRKEMDRKKHVYCDHCTAHTQTKTQWNEQTFKGWEEKEMRREIKQTKRRERDKKRDVRMKKCLLRASSARRGSGYWNCDHCGTQIQTKKQTNKKGIITNNTIYSDNNISVARRSCSYWNLDPCRTHKTTEFHF